VAKFPELFGLYIEVPACTYVNFLNSQFKIKHFNGAKQDKKVTMEAAFGFLRVNWQWLVLKPISNS
jgi:hypothetical protein